MDEIERLNYCTAIAELVATAMGWSAKKGYEWMQIRNPLLGDVAPAVLVMQGRGHKVLKFITAAIDENGLLRTSKTEKDSSRG
jgi:hypothetical protein